jgi:hypothetical protein
MAKISNKSEKEKILLADKVKIIYDLLCRKDILELVELFSDPLDAKENPNYYHNRKKSLQRIIRNQTASVSHFQKAYSRMKISKLRFGKSALFGREFFFSSSLDRFKRHLEIYIDAQAVKEIGLDLEYKYLYFFDHKDKKNNMVMDRYKIEYMTKNIPDIDRGLEINLYHSYQNYKGYIKNDRQRIVINVKNRYDNLTMLFNASLLGSSSCIYFDKALYGVAIGIDDEHQKIPVAKKVVLMQYELDDIELEKLYLILNETESIKVRDSLYALESNMSFNINYLSKYKEKITNIHNFFSTLKYSKHISTQISDHMVFTEFHAFCELYSKYADSKNFFLNDRKRIVLELMRYIGMYRSTNIKMVLPIYDSSENIFLYDALHKDISILDLLLNHAKSGIKFDIVFVVRKPKDYLAPHMEGIFAKLDDAGVEFSFVDEISVERKVNNLDFIYSLEHDFTIIKSHSAHKAVFTIDQSTESIKSSIKNFQILKKESINYPEVLEDDCKLAIHDHILVQMLGTWYGYFYSSIKDENQEPLLWEIEYTVLSDYTIYSKREKNCNSDGMIETAQHQTLFSLVCKETKNSHYLVFDNHRIDDMFQVMLYAKEYNNEYDMANAGILSREKLSSSLVRSLLGEPESLMLIIKSDLSERIKMHILNRKVSSLIESK